MGWAAPAGVRRAMCVCVWGRAGVGAFLWGAHTQGMQGAWGGAWAPHSIPASLHPELDPAPGSHTGPRTHLLPLRPTPRGLNRSCTPRSTPRPSRAPCSHPSPQLRPAVVCQAPGDPASLARGPSGSSGRSLHGGGLVWSSAALPPSVPARCSGHPGRTAASPRARQAPGSQMNPKCRMNPERPSVGDGWAPKGA